MPGLNGFELSTGVVEEYPQCKVILFSGNPSVREGYATLVLGVYIPTTNPKQSENGSINQGYTASRIAERDPKQIGLVG